MTTLLYIYIFLFFGWEGAITGKLAIHNGVSSSPAFTVNSKPTEIPRLQCTCYLYLTYLRNKSILEDDDVIHLRQEVDVMGD